MRNGKQARMGRRNPKEGIKDMVTQAKEAQKTQQKPIEMKDWNGPEMPKEMKRAEDAQKNKMG